MAFDSRHARATPPDEQQTFSADLRFELVDEEQRALLGSYAIASAMGLGFLLLVQFGPHPIVPPFDPGPIVFAPTGTFGIAPVPTRVIGTNDAGRTVVGAGSRGSSSSSRAGSIASAFGVREPGGVVDAGNLLGNVAVTRSGTGEDAGTGGKTVLGYGSTGYGSAALARGGISGGGGGTIGNVATGGGVVRSGAPVAAPAVVPVDALPPAGDVGSVGTVVRAHESQLRFCYQESGLKVDPALAGSITVALTVASNGSVAAASVTKRTWSGAGAAGAEACILRVIRGWQLPATGTAATTYSFPFNFSR